MSGFVVRYGILTVEVAEYLLGLFACLLAWYADGIDEGPSLREESTG